MFLKNTLLTPLFYSMEMNALKHSYRYSLLEGLVTSYSIDKIIDILAAGFSLQKYENSDNDFYNEMIAVSEKRSPYNGFIKKAKGNNNSETIWIVVPKDDRGLNKKMLDSYLIPSGYICFSKNETYYSDEDSGISFVWYIYEKKFDNDVTDSILNNKDYLYHITLNLYIDKIKRQGLKPKDEIWNNDLFPSHNRLYLFLNDNLFDKSDTYFSNKDLKRKYNNGFSLLRIDVSKLNNNIKLYSDPRQNDAVYTYDCISPDAIEVIDVKYFK